MLYFLVILQSQTIAISSDVALVYLNRGFKFYKDFQYMYSSFELLNAPFYW